MKPLNTLILLASEQKLRLLHSTGGRMIQISHVTQDQMPDLDYEFADRAPRAHGGGLIGNQHSLDPRQSEGDKERGRLVKHAVDLLAREWAQGIYDRMVVCAPAKLLGLLRDAMPKELAAHIVADMPKDLVKTPLHDLAGHFTDIAQI